MFFSFKENKVIILKFFYDEKYWDKFIRSGVVKRSWGVFEKDIIFLSVFKKSGEFDNVYLKIKKLV